jgi:hypothetical protein
MAMAAHGGEPVLRVTGLIVGDWRDGDCDGSYSA